MRLNVALGSGFTLSVALAGSVVLAADQEKDKRPPVFGSEVSIVSLPVFVVDPSGQAARGLRVEDFELFDDGKRVPVVSFQHIDNTSAEEQEAIRQSSAARRRFLLLFDLSFIDAAGIHRAQTAAREFVTRRLAESDLAAVATIDVNRGVRLVANFTEDRVLLRHAVDTLGAPSYVRISDPLSLAADLGHLDAEVAPGRSTEVGADSVEAATRYQLRLLRAVDEANYRRDVEGLMAGLDELGRALRGVEGRKQVVYFSAGFDSRALSGTGGDDARLDADAVVDGRLWEIDGTARYGDPRLRKIFSEMTDVFNRADCLIHAVDVTGLGGEDTLARTDAPVQSVRSHAGRESLNAMAAETGGRFYSNTNDLNRILDELLGMSNRYYVLGYQPQDLGGPGRYHKIRVKVHRKGMRASHRPGFFERTPLSRQAPLQRKFEAAQLVMSGTGQNRIHFSVLCLPFPADAELQTIGVVVQIPRTEVSWRKELGFEVYGYAVAADGSVLDHIAQFARIDPTKADPAGNAQGLAFFGDLKVPPGRYTLKFLVLEPEGGDAGIQFFDVNVPPRDARTSFLLPPFIQDQVTRWLNAGMQRRGSQLEASPFVVNGELLVPRASFEVTPGSPETIVLMAFEPNRAQDPAAGILIQSRITDSNGNVFPAGKLRLNRLHREENGRRVYLLDFTPHQLPPGEYTLRIGIGEGGEQIESYSLLRIRKPERHS